MNKNMNYLTLGIHYPKTEHRDDIIKAAEKVAARTKELKLLKLKEMIFLRPL